MRITFPLYSARAGTLERGRQNVVRHPGAGRASTIELRRTDGGGIKMTQSAIGTDPGKQGSRIASVDFMRGLALVVMAIDHSRDFLTNIPFRPENMTQTYPALFVTRWITHFCAPLFFFLAGTGAYLLRRQIVSPGAAF